MKKMFRSIVVGAALLLAIAPAALSQEYPPDEPSVGVSDTVVSPGEPVTSAVDGLAPGSTATWTLFSHPIHLGSARADGEGRATLTFTVPNHAHNGRHTLVAEGVDPDGNPVRVSTSLTVTGATGQPAPTTPGTPGTPATPTPGDTGAGTDGTGPGGTGSDEGSSRSGGTGGRSAADASGDSLPRTGNDVLAPIATGMGLVLAGLGIVFLARKRAAARVTA